MNIILFGGSELELEQVVSSLLRLKFFDPIRPIRAYAMLAGQRLGMFAEANKIIDDDALTALACTSILSLPAGVRFVLEGYPSTVAQSKEICSFLEAHKIRIAGVFYFSEPEEDILLVLKNIAPVHMLSNNITAKENAEFIIKSIAS